MKPIPLSSNDFPTIREKGQIYVDKTGYLHKLITDPNTESFFLSRPRRFGKSLMISTLKAIFQGRRELFDGLAISKTDYDWKIHPVIHLNMGFCARDCYKNFLPSFAQEIRRALKECDIEYDSSLDVADNFGNALDTLTQRGPRPVILIDEYDDPVARTLAKIEEAEAIRNALASIYGQLKDRSGKIRFLMITGVSKFTKMSIFSALSSLTDISFDDEYATMLGFTEKELDAYYGEYTDAHAARMGLSTSAYKKELKRMYNGYRFGRFTADTVFNPVSINTTLVKRNPGFLCGWAETGRPSMLMNFLKREDALALDPEEVLYAASGDFDVADLARINLKPLLFQTGYLTIKDYNPYSGLYTLCIPDEEVRQDLSLLMASLCANKPVSWASSVGANLLTANWDAFFQGLKSLYAGVAYGPREARVCEYSYARCLSFLLQGQGIVCRQEDVQSDGRADMVCTHPCGIYIFELKVDQPAVIAMEQIQRKGYAAPYAADSRPIWLFGLSFDSQTRQLVDHAVQDYRK